MYHPKTDAYHFPYGDYQGKKTGRWERELHGSDPHQARRSASLPREPDLRPKTGPQAWGRKCKLELDGRRIFDHLKCWFNGRCYEAPISMDGLANITGASVYLQLGE